MKWMVIGSRAMGGILGPRPVLNVHECLVPMYVLPAGPTSMTYLG